jgi:hypothetical protein
VGQPDPSLPRLEYVHRKGACVLLRRGWGGGGEKQTLVFLASFFVLVALQSSSSLSRSFLLATPLRVLVVVVVRSRLTSPSVSSSEKEKEFARFRLCENLVDVASSSSSFSPLLHSPLLAPSSSTPPTPPSSPYRPSGSSPCPFLRPRDCHVLMRTKCLPLEKNDGD